MDPADSGRPFKEMKGKVVFDNGVLVMLLKDKPEQGLYANGVELELKDVSEANKEIDNGMV